MEKGYLVFRGDGVPVLFLEGYTKEEVVEYVQGRTEVSELDSPDGRRQTYGYIEVPVHKNPRQ